MKKRIPIGLCIALVAALPACGGRRGAEDGGTLADPSKDTVYEMTTEVAAPILIPETGGFGDYGSVLALYRTAAQSAYFVNTNFQAAAAESELRTEEEIELFRRLYGSVGLFFPRREALEDCGYALKDLNGDGVDELIWLSRAHPNRIVAVFSAPQGTPLCLGAYQPFRDSCWIDRDGLLHEEGNSGADSSVVRVSRIAEGGASLELLVEFGTDGHEWVDGVGVTRYYKIVDGVKTDVTESEYRALYDRYGTSAYPKDDAAEGLTFVPLFGEITVEEAVEIASDHWNIRVGDVDPDTGYPYGLFPVENQTENPHVHVIMLKWLVAGTHYSTVDEIWVDRITGEIVQPNWYRTLYGTLFELALSNQYALHIGDTGEMAYLKDIRTPYLGIPLTEMWEDISYAYLDMDGDGIEECVLFCGVDILILRGHEGRGYLYAFPFNHMNTLYADGSFSWSDDGAYGQSRLTFDGINARIRELWRVKGDGTPDAVYFVEGQQVTKTELDAFVAACPAAPLEWTPMDVPLLTDGK